MTDEHQLPQNAGIELDREDQWLRGLLRDHAPAVRALLRARYLSFDAADIDDVVIIALTRLWTVRHRYEREKSSLKTFFFRIADNVARNVLKCGWYQARILEVDLNDRHVVPGTVVSDAGDDSSDAGVVCGAGVGPQGNSQLLEDLRTIIDELPENYRRIILADGCSPDRVASAELLSQELQIPAGTVRVYRNRAMNAIRVSLQKLGYKLP
jgi:RNA polymerase sigma factor (sigma-70 family)